MYRKTINDDYGHVYTSNFFQKIYNICIQTQGYTYEHVVHSSTALDTETSDPVVLKQSIHHSRHSTLSHSTCTAGHTHHTLTLGVHGRSHSRTPMHIQVCPTMLRNAARHEAVAAHEE